MQTDAKGKTVYIYYSQTKWVVHLEKSISEKTKGGAILEEYAYKASAAAKIPAAPPTKTMAPVGRGAAAAKLLADDGEGVAAEGLAELPAEGAGEEPLPEDEAPLVAAGVAPLAVTIATAAKGEGISLSSELLIVTVPLDSISRLLATGPVCVMEQVRSAFCTSPFQLHF